MLGGRALRLGQTWKVAAWEIAQLGSCHLEKYSWEVAAWKKAFRKVPNIILKRLQNLKEDFFCYCRGLRLSIFHV